MRWGISIKASRQGASLGRSGQFANVYLSREAEAYFAKGL
jgi:hypothetical protein